MVVPVLIISCQVSEKWNSGPLIAQRIKTTTADRNINGWPTSCAVLLANRLNQSLTVLVLATCCRALLRGDFWFPLAVPFLDLGVSSPLLLVPALFTMNRCRFPPRCKPRARLPLTGYDLPR